MRDTIREKLNRIAELYPKERLDKSKERWRRAWGGEPVLDHYPFMYSPSFDYYDAALDMDAWLNRLLDEIIRRGPIDDDFIPTLFPGCRQSTIPVMLGASLLKMLKFGFPLWGKISLEIILVREMKEIL
jgi:hypothetical protein